jgi:dienelactone hydrolase
LKSDNITLAAIMYVNSSTGLRDATKPQAPERGFTIPVHLAQPNALNWASWVDDRYTHTPHWRRGSIGIFDLDGKVALLGYCLGALMVFMTAVRNDGIDAAVWYHGADTEKYLGEADGLHAPLLLHVAEEDEFISKAAQAEIKAALAKKPNATIYSYPGQNHAFSSSWGALQRRRGSPCQRSDERISERQIAMTAGRPGETFGV